MTSRQGGPQGTLGRGAVVPLHPYTELRLLAPNRPSCIPGLPRTAQPPRDAEISRATVGLDLSLNPLVAPAQIDPAALRGSHRGISHAKLRRTKIK